MHPVRRPDVHSANSDVLAYHFAGQDPAGDACRLRLAELREWNDGRARHSVTTVRHSSAAQAASMQSFAATLSARFNSHVRHDGDVDSSGEHPRSLQGANVLRLWLPIVHGGRLHRHAHLPKQSYHARPGHSQSLAIPATAISQLQIKQDCDHDIDMMATNHRTGWNVSTRLRT